MQILPRGEGRGEGKLFFGVGKDGLHVVEDLLCFGAFAQLLIAVIEDDEKVVVGGEVLVDAGSWLCSK